MTSPIDCKHQVHGNCQISTDLARMPVPIAQDACAACILQANPRTKNAVTCSKAIQYRSLVGMLPTEELLECVKPPSRGVGAELDILVEKTRTLLQCVSLGWLIPPQVQCGCAATRSYMNQQGIHGCLSNRSQLTEEILARWKKHLPAIRFIPFTRFIVGVYITRAIERFKDKETTYG